MIEYQFNQPKPFAVIVDLDGTLCDHEHRVHLATQGLWDEFNSAHVDDEPNHDVRHFIQNFDWSIHTMVVLSGRDSTYVETTRQWLKRHGVFPDAIIMRPKHDYRPDTEIKIALLEEFFGSKEEVLEKVKFVLDDRDKVVEALRNYGLPVWQVRQGRY